MRMHVYVPHIMVPAGESNVRECYCMCAGQASNFELNSIATHLCAAVDDAAWMLKTSFSMSNASPPPAGRRTGFARSCLPAGDNGGWSKRTRGADFGGTPEPKATAFEGLLDAPARTQNR